MLLYQIYELERIHVITIFHVFSVIHVSCFKNTETVSSTQFSFVIYRYVQPMPSQLLRGPEKFLIQYGIATGLNASPIGVFSILSSLLHDCILSEIFNITINLFQFHSMLLLQKTFRSCLSCYKTELLKTTAGVPVVLWWSTSFQRSSFVTSKSITLRNT